MERSYKGNIGFQEMVQFYQSASPEEIDQMERIVKSGDWQAYKKLIKKKLGVSLK